MTATSHDAHHEGPPSGFLRRWLFTTNHKDIGTLYLVFSLVMFFIGGLMALVIRAELFQPGMQLVDPYFFNQMTTNHALVMIFGAVMPAFTGLANWMIPIMIGAPGLRAMTPIAMPKDSTVARNTRSPPKRALILAPTMMKAATTRE